MKKIAIIGAGGICSWATKHLFDVTKLFEKDTLMYVKIFDNDIVEEKNIKRMNQNFTTEDLMEEKAEVLANRYKFDFDNILITEENIDEKLSTFDDIIIGVDSLKVRKLIYEFCHKNKKYMLDLRANGTRTAYYVMDHERTWESYIEQHFNNAEVLERKGSCQLVKDVENDHIENGNKFIAYYGIWCIYFKQLRGEKLEKLEFRDVY